MKVNMAIRKKDFFVFILLGFVLIGQIFSQSKNPLNNTTWEEWRGDTHQILQFGESGFKWTVNSGSYNNYEVGTYEIRGENVTLRGSKIIYNGILFGDTLTVSNAIYGYEFKRVRSDANSQNNSKSVPKENPAIVGQEQNRPRLIPKDLMEVFDTSSVKDTFNAIHTFLQTCNSGTGDRRERIAQRIMLGDWIDLPRLTVQGDTGGGSINTTNVDLGGNRKLLRLIVVGIDSFVKTNQDAPAHIVFQFQNIPITHRMNSWDTNMGGYKESEMRNYLTNGFLRGLLATGLPESVLYAPTRYIASNGERGEAHVLKDWLWLPTMWEMFGFPYFENETCETAVNQARLEYYEKEGHRIKYSTNGKAVSWWLSSPVGHSTGKGDPAPQSNFNIIGEVGYSDIGGGSWPDSYAGEFASRSLGVAPAFCVR